MFKGKKKVTMYCHQPCTKETNVLSPNKYEGHDHRIKRSCLCWTNTGLWNVASGPDCFSLRLGQAKVPPSVQFSSVAPSCPTLPDPDSSWPHESTAPFLWLPEGGTGLLTNRSVFYLPVLVMTAGRAEAVWCPVCFSQPGSGHSSLISPALLSLPLSFAFSGAALANWSNTQASLSIPRCCKSLSAFRFPLFVCTLWDRCVAKERVPWCPPHPGLERDGWFESLMQSGFSSFSLFTFWNALGTEA